MIEVRAPVTGKQDRANVEKVTHIIRDFPF